LGTWRVKMYKLPVAEDSLLYALILLVLGVIFFFISIPLSVIFLTLLICVLLFFRNPRRKIQTDENLILSPADGKVMSVTEDYVTAESVMEKSVDEKFVKVSIFLSLFNVHINRSPIKGYVRYIAYTPGKFLPAFKSHASDINEKNTVVIEGKSVKVLVRQITGFIARRIVCRVRVGSFLKAGESFGLIKFGSCTEIVFPDSIEVKVKPGEKVKGGITVIGVARQNERH
jgi:phosphatidylserine decarboxylase